MKILKLDSREVQTTHLVFLGNTNLSPRALTYYRNIPIHVDLGYITVAPYNRVQELSGIETIEVISELIQNRKYGFIRYASGLIVIFEDHLCHSDVNDAVTMANVSDRIEIAVSAGYISKVHDLLSGDWKGRTYSSSHGLSLGSQHPYDSECVKKHLAKIQIPEDSSRENLQT